MEICNFPAEAALDVRRKWGKRMERTRQENAFCAAYLRTMDPQRAAEESGCMDGYSVLRRKAVRERLERMRDAAAGELRREDVLRRLAELAFGRANYAARLALRPGETDPERLELSAVSELKVTDKGVEIKFVDRVRALETLWNLLESGGSGGAEELYQALEDIAGHMEGANG